MIKVRSISIQEFRGIRSLDLEFKDKNFAICGRNGTGKSGVVDAIEFALTGNISRLIGTGTGGISIKDHAPHVDSRSNPSKSKVKISLWIPTLNKLVSIDRSVKDPGNPVIIPNDPTILKVLSEIASHPEFTLTRRELIKYVISTPGDRAKEVQVLLKLEKVESLRAILLRISNATSRDVIPLKGEKENARKSLMSALEITELNQARILEAVNPKREILGLKTIENIEQSTLLTDGIVSNPATQSTIPKLQALADIKRLKEVFQSLREVDKQPILEKIQEFAKNPAILTGISKEKFLRDAIQFVQEEICPVCDTPWKLEELRGLIENKLKSHDAVAEKRKEVESQLIPFNNKLQELISIISVIENYGVLAKPKIELTNTTNYKRTIQSRKSQIQSLLPINDCIVALEQYSNHPKEVEDEIISFETAIKAIPDPSSQDSAKHFLIIAQERLETYKSASSRLKQAESREELANKIFNSFAKTSTDFLENIYKEVEKDFSELYRLINSEDEGGFTAQLIPSIGKLGFNVDFYGRGFFPPGAYHSEGHQDGMGLCLYLALMKHLLKESFTFAVLDDVLMSVDSGHRREVCTLLKEKFPNTQFILTTHDEVWLKHMKSAGLVSGSSSVLFKKWDVDNGPSIWNDRKIWEEIEDKTLNGDVREAASLLRHYLEFISSEICHRIRAKVEFRGDGQFQLGDLLPSATSHFQKLLEEGEKVANSWGNLKDEESIKKRKVDFKTLVNESQLEQWPINVAIHYNSWVNLHPNDFKSVYKAFNCLINSFFCPAEDCGSLLTVVPDRGNRDCLRCNCSSININLIKKKLE